jgi:hypoxanthine phosphoribosyltransferase
MEWNVDREKTQALSLRERAVLLREIGRRLALPTLSRERCESLAHLIEGKKRFEFQWGKGVSVWGNRDRISWTGRLINLRKNLECESRMSEPDYKIGKILYTELEIAERVQLLADKIVSETPNRDLLVVGILNGAVIFLSDLVRRMPPDFNVKIDFMSISSYENAVKSSGVVRILKDVGSDIEGRDVLVVEDIIDTGLTLSYLLDMLCARRPKRLRTCVLLDKHEKREVPVTIDYCGFPIPDAFVVGYGLDCGGKWRHLQDIRIVDF